jgi:hypothetical protein
MASQNEDYVAGFKQRFLEMQQVQGLVAKLSDTSQPGWSQGRDAIIQRQFKGKDSRAVMAALADSTPDIVDGYATVQYNDTTSEATTYFGKNKQAIVAKIPKSQLEEIALSVTPAKLGDDHPRAKVHNPAAGILAGYQQVVQMNNAVANGEMDSFAYREFMAGQVADQAKAISGINVSEKSKGLFIGATQKLVYKSDGMARHVGDMVAAGRKKQFNDYFAEQKKAKDGYTVVEFTQNNLIYGPADKTMPLVGTLLTAEPKKKK